MRKQAFGPATLVEFLDWASRNIIAESRVRLPRQIMIKVDGESAYSWARGIPAQKTKKPAARKRRALEE